MTHRDWRPKRTGDEAFPVFPDRAGIGWSEGGHIGSMDGKRAMSGSTGKRSAIFWRHVEGVRVQGSVIGALMMRELHTRYGRQGLGYLWLILEPMILASLVASLRTFRSGGHYATGIDPVAFIIMGYTLFVMFRNIWNRSDGALESNMTLLYHRMVSVFDIIMSRVLLEGAGCLCAFIVLMAFSILVGWAHPPARPLEFIIGFALLIWWSLGFSMLICAWSYDNTTLQKFVHPVSYIMMPLSGAFFMAEWLPYKWQEPISWWPMMSIFEQLRYGWFEPASPDHRFLAYTAGCCMVLTFLGLLSIRVVRRKVQLQ